MRRRLSRVVFALTVLCTALLAHVAIDLAGDVLLERDAYDNVAHHSRESIFIAACLLAAVILWRTFLTARAEIAGSCGSLRAALGGAVPASCVRFVATVAAAALPALLAMAALDSALDARPLGDAGELLGGSVLLGVASVLASSLTCGTLVWKAVRALARLDRAILRLVTILARRARYLHGAARVRLEFRPRARAAAVRCVRCVGWRAPPFPA